MTTAGALTHRDLGRTVSLEVRARRFTGALTAVAHYEDVTGTPVSVLAVGGYVLAVDARDVVVAGPPTP